MVGAVIAIDGGEYRLLRLLGKGKGGYSYLAGGPQGQVVVKQIHHEPCSYYQFGDKLAAELHDYERLLAAGVPVPRLLAVDREKERLVKEYIPGETVYELVLADRAQPEWVEQMEILCRRLYAVGLNIDYFPTNFIPHGGVLWYVDYECNEYQEQWDFQHWGVKYWSKTPELLDHARNTRGPDDGK